jgi:hypothetical protein
VYWSYAFCDFEVSDIGSLVEREKYLPDPNMVSDDIVGE